MKKIEVTFSDGSHQAFPSGVVGLEVVKKFPVKEAIALKIDNAKIIDLMTPIEKDCHVRILTPTDRDALEVLRHSTAHIMSEAVQKLFPGAKVTIGPATEQGFYYDYDFEPGFTPEDLNKIEKKMSEIIESKSPFQRTTIDKKEALKKFRAMKEDYKVEILNQIPEEKVSLYKHGKWEDLCRGPHLPHTGWVKAFKLLSIAGAYWRGNVKNKMLQRIYGTAFFSKKELGDFLHQLEEGKKRDHRKLAKELDLLSFHSEAPSSPFFHPKGAAIYEGLEAYWNEMHRVRHYEFVKTPFILSSELWHRSGHYENYKENMYFVNIDEQEYAVKPMNCPGHILIFQSHKHSYREFPIRLAEIGQVHRHELSGVAHGLMRVRTFSIDDAHIFCREDQIEGEISSVVDLVLTMYKTFGFHEYKMELSTRPEKSIGSDEMWGAAISALENALKKTKLEYQINPGEGAFYGPKIDFHVKDVLGRMWQCGTIQLDFSMPERFDLTYTGSDGKEHRPVMIHRAVYGSLERFLGILIEHYGGAFPVWLSPVQAVVMNVTDRQLPYAEKIYEALGKGGIRADSDFRNEKLGFKIREAQLKKIPYMVIIGDREMESQTLSLRERGGKTSEGVPLEVFFNRIKNEVEQRR